MPGARAGGPSARRRAWSCSAGWPDRWAGPGLAQGRGGTGVRAGTAVCTGGSREAEPHSRAAPPGHTESQAAVAGGRPRRGAPPARERTAGLNEHVVEAALRGERGHLARQVVAQAAAHAAVGERDERAAVPPAPCGGPVRRPLPQAQSGLRARRPGGAPAGARAPAHVALDGRGVHVDGRHVVDDHGHAQPARAGQQVRQQRRLAGAQEAREHRHRQHRRARPLARPRGLRSRRRAAARAGGAALPRRRVCASRLPARRHARAPCDGAVADSREGRRRPVLQAPSAARQEHRATNPPRQRSGRSRLTQEYTRVSAARRELLAERSDQRLVSEPETLGCPGSLGNRQAGRRAQFRCVPGPWLETRTTSRQRSCSSRGQGGGRGLRGALTAVR